MLKIDSETKQFKMKWKRNSQHKIEGGRLLCAMAKRIRSMWDFSNFLLYNDSSIRSAIHLI